VPARAEIAKGEKNMSKEKKSVPTEFEGNTTSQQKEKTRGSSRRQFLGQVGVAAGLAAGTFAAPAVASAQEGPRSVSGAAAAAGVTNGRVLEAFELRVAEAMSDALLGPAKNVNNGDQALYADYGGTYTKGLAHDAYGRVTAASFASFETALNTGKFSAFEEIIVGGSKTLNGPQAAYAFDLTAPDNAQFGQPQVPPAPPIAGAVSGTELLEHYWGALLNDVNFTDYDSNPLAAEAAAELGSHPSYLGPRTSGGQVTPDLLFRGSFPGETQGPYTSQFFIQPTYFGSQPISQLQKTFVPGVEYGTNFTEWLQIQNGQPTGRTPAFDPTLRYRRNGRDYAAFTHVDVLYQAYFTAFLVLAGIGAPLNPGNPYVGSKTENGFGTFGGPDFAASIGDVASKALNVVWYQKWLVHLRPRPEAAGGQVQLVKTGQSAFTDVIPNATVLNSVGLQTTYNTYGSWLLPLAFPEGSPTHPAYPTGHGTVGGACITLIKFFYDGSQLLQPLLEKSGTNVVVSSEDGLSLLPYTGADAAELTINGELNKLGHNVSFGHGIHAGIHWRSDSDTSLLLGEAFALAYLRDKARTCNEPFSVSLTKFDGTRATISNVGNP
jgi:hypothetical protein